MGHYSHLSIEEREDIMVWWKNHESISQSLQCTIYRFSRRV